MVEGKQNCFEGKKRIRDSNQETWVFKELIYPSHAARNIFQGIFEETKYELLHYTWFSHERFVLVYSRVKTNTEFLWLLASMDVSRGFVDSLQEGWERATASYQRPDLPRNAENP